MNSINLTTHLVDWVPSQSANDVLAHNTSVGFTPTADDLQVEVIGPIDIELRVSPALNIGLERTERPALAALNMLSHRVCFASRPPPPKRFGKITASSREVPDGLSLVIHERVLIPRTDWLSICAKLQSLDVETDKAMSAFLEGSRATDFLSMLRGYGAAVELGVSAWVRRQGLKPLSGDDLDAAASAITRIPASSFEKARNAYNRAKHPEKNENQREIYRSVLSMLPATARESRQAAIAVLRATLPSD